ncbi:unnamed protein product [Cuscuta epithymum]|uniref:RNA-directed DNA polymerase (Reverse transcriptase) n=1 Tax=Cuscuta epithymum TaxID=186058 RepID=A0AAV0FNN7_9ASTE|nr:unnamed protein product [Cuscuta epithymum]
MPTYAMIIFLLPKDLYDEVEKLMNGFWWRGSKFDQKGLRWRKWEALCKPKDAGGLGFRRLREFNLAMLAKQGWRLINESGSLMSRVLHARRLLKIIQEKEWGTVLTFKSRRMHGFPERSREE